MKKLISILISISICLMLVISTPSVFAYKNTTVIVSNVLLDDGTYSVTVKGSCEPDSYISIFVTKGTDLGAAEQCESNSSGVYTHTFPVEALGDYTVIVNNYKSNSRISKHLTLYNLTTLEDAVAEFKNATTSGEIINCITLYGHLFGFDTTYYNSGSQEYVATQMLAMKNDITRFNICEKFDEASLRAYIYDIKTDTENVLEYYYICYHKYKWL